MVSYYSLTAANVLLFLMAQVELRCVSPPSRKPELLSLFQVDSSRVLRVGIAEYVYVMMNINNMPK